MLFYSLHIAKLKGPKSFVRRRDLATRSAGENGGSTYEVSGLKIYATPATRRLPINP